MRLKRKSPDVTILLAVVLLLMIGLLMVMSASSVRASYEYEDPFFFFKRQMMFAVMGLAVLVVLMRFDYRRLSPIANGFLIVSLILLLALFIPGVGKKVLGSTRWLNLGPASFQPSELVKLAVIFFLAKALSRDQHQLLDLFKGLGPYLALMGFIGLVLVVQKDLGTALAICGTMFLMLFVAGARTKHMGWLFGAGVGLVALAAYIEPYRMRRITGFLDPEADPQGAGYQLLQSLYALGGGGLFGSGLGQSKQKFFYLPEHHTDFIFAILGEEFGTLGAAVVIALFFLLIWRGIRVGVTCPDAFGSLLAVGLTAQVGLQAVINMGVVTGLLPVTGITLPFLSYGGSSLVFTLAGIGLLLSVSRYSPR
ncbi:putative lipid II flippase FtsW [Heliophilum fasciatum]|uniref:Probable peptidoglycan glycosyltransferase FtsW n=1 Tax=Heliophilum fasciatum TaxID=35700 RepID=A0A4R2RGQ0_9FIRM|nr:putative lipid II flippase FtsW [Heliophilum fasciatum]MCW2278855.1 cell division protein FtsW [Heliophilum fasciatum]TCP62133.1 cell division protein FtsW [Heliophilum fasciatum]